MMETRISSTHSFTFSRLSIFLNPVLYSFDLGLAFLLAQLACYFRVVVELETAVWGFWRLAEEWLLLS
jgi:hypothetical protein